MIGGGLVIVNYHLLPVGLRRHAARGDVTTLLIGADPFDPDDSHGTPLSLDVEVAPLELQEAVWREAVGDDSIAPPTAFRFGPRQILRAVEAARAQALSAGLPLNEHHLVAGARRQFERARPICSPARTLGRGGTASSFPTRRPVDSAS